MHPAVKPVASPTKAALRAAMRHRADTYTLRQLLMTDRLCVDIDADRAKHLAAIPTRPIKAHSRQR